MSDHYPYSAPVTVSQFEKKYNKKIGPTEMSATERCRFLEALLPVLWLAKVFGVLPLIIHRNSVRFKWASLAFMYWVFITSIQLVFAILRLVAAIVVKDRNDSWIDIAQACIFHILAALACFFLLRLAMKFPSLMASYLKLEKNVDLEPTSNLKRTVLIVTIVFMCSAVGETTSARFYRFNVIKPQNFSMYLEEHTLRIHEGVMKLLGFSDVLGVIVIIITELTTFIWNYVDLIITVIAITLIEIMNGYNERIKKACSMATNGQKVNWVPLKRLNMEIYILNLEVGDSFGILILLSYVANLFFILLQLYNGLKNIIQSTGLGKYDANDFVYLTWSFLHVMGRLLLVTLTCARFHEASMEEHPSLLSLYDEESIYPDGFRRLIHQMENLTFGLGGVGFFLISKTFFVAIVSALITYEVILLQMSPTASAFTGNGTVTT